MPLPLDLQLIFGWPQSTSLALQNDIGFCCCLITPCSLQLIYLGHQPAQLNWVIISWWAEDPEDVSSHWVTLSLRKIFPLWWQRLSLGNLTNSKLSRYSQPSNDCCCLACYGLLTHCFHPSRFKTKELRPGWCFPLQKTFSSKSRFPSQTGKSRACVLISSTVVSHLSLCHISW